MPYDYTQEAKNSVRHLVLSHAVNHLTVDRSRSCCVPRTYVRRVIDYFLQQDPMEPCYKEAQKIEQNYIIHWEALHDAIIGHRNPSELSVCYLSGPQPQNDFEKLISLGVLPQNIWAFENDRKTYLQAVGQYMNVSFPQPKIIKMPIEQFFCHTPKKFDIVYIDACGSIWSSQHALRCVSSLLYYQRLQPLGVLITNFSKPDITKDKVLQEYTKMLTLYQIFKETPNIRLACVDNILQIKGAEDIYRKIYSNFNEYYGEFIASLISDLAAIIIPIMRFGELAPFSNLFSEKELSECNNHVELDMINRITHNSICRWLLTLEWLTQYPQKTGLFSTEKLHVMGDLVGIGGSREKLVRGIKLFTWLKEGKLELDHELNSIQSFFDSGNNLYQFLDRCCSSLFFDVVINQLTYPMHSNIEQYRSYQYCAKQTDMFTDVTVLDECRYLYEWLPAVHQMQNAMRNKSWQYVFRFSLDALVKQRMQYNNEFFFQGSVISKNEKGFTAKERAKRVEIGGGML